MWRFRDQSTENACYIDAGRGPRTGVHADFHAINLAGTTFCAAPAPQNFLILFASYREFMLNEQRLLSPCRADGGSASQWPPQGRERARWGDRPCVRRE